MIYRETLTYFWFILDTEEKVQTFNNALEKGELTGEELIDLYSALDIPIADIVRYSAPRLKVRLGTEDVLTYTALLVTIIEEE